MNQDNNERLAEIYTKDYPQIITIFPNVWKHFKEGNWFLLHRYLGY